MLSSATLRTGAVVFTRSAEIPVAAGLLQLFFGWFGLGRFYVGSPGTAFTQLALGILGIGTVFFIVGFFILVPLSIWTFIDAILMFSGNVKDKEGRKLR